MKENTVVRSTIWNNYELEEKLKQGWIVKFITHIGNGNTLEYILERVKE